MTAGAASAITGEPRDRSLVIPTWNAGERFAEVLEAVASQDLERGVELLVIDSGSTDGTRERAAAAGARVVEIPQREFNHGGTRNRAIELTHGDLVALLTQDAVPIGRDYLRRLFEPFASSNVAGVYARQFPRPDCDPILAERLRRWSASRDEPALQVLAPRAPEESRRLFDELEPMERYLTCVFDNVASAVRRTAWQAHPFPERSFGEDVAWAREVLLDGRAIAYQPEASVEHSHRIDMVREFKRLYCDHKNLMELFELRTVPTWRAVRAGWRGQVGVYAELLASQALPWHARLYWRLYALPYAFLEGAAQFLGARSSWKTRSSRFWRWFDGRVRRGV